MEYWTTFSDSLYCLSAKAPDFTRAERNLHDEGIEIQLQVQRCNSQRGEFERAGKLVNKKGEAHNIGKIGQDKRN